MSSLSTTESCTKKIYSTVEGKPPIGITENEPSSQNVVVGGDDLVTKWKFNKQADGSYKLSIGEYSSTGVDGNKVFVSNKASDNVKWILTSGAAQNTVVITLQNDTSQGWTVVQADDDKQKLLIQPIVVGKSGYSASQVFELKSTDED